MAFDLKLTKERIRNQDNKTFMNYLVKRMKLGYDELASALDKRGIDLNGTSSFEDLVRTYRDDIQEYVFELLEESRE